MSGPGGVQHPCVRKLEKRMNAVVMLGMRLQVGYFHGYLDGVDYVFIDHACFQGRQGDIYGGDRQSIQFRCVPACLFLPQAMNY